jgi:transposase
LASCADVICATAEGVIRWFVDLTEVEMGTGGLFGDLPLVAELGPKAVGAPRLREPVRDQIELRPVDLDALLAAEHPARVIWDYVQNLDLRELEDRVRAREHTPGQAPVSPRLLLALWLFATSQGIGSARALDRLCKSHDAYRWLCGGVSVNYHGLSEFRVGHTDLLDRLLTENVATLSMAGVIDLDEVVQDGVRVRAAAGASSFRRKKKLHKELRKAERLIGWLKHEADDDPDASNRRIRAAQERAARERAERVAAAQKALSEIERRREQRARKQDDRKGRKKEPRASTTDPDARVMKMPDGGFRPAYNCQIGTVACGQIVIAVQAEQSGSDRGLIRPMLDQLRRRYLGLPRRHLVDGGFNKNEDTEWAAAAGVNIYGAPIRNKHKTDPYAPRDGDRPGVAAWRRRMKSPHGKAVYKRRSMGECINARLRQWGLLRLTVRGRDKVNIVLHWFALANNILAGRRLMTTVA